MKHRTYSAYTKNIVDHSISKILHEADTGKYDDPLFKPSTSSTPTPSLATPQAQCQQLSDDQLSLDCENGEYSPNEETSNSIILVLKN